MDNRVFVQNFFDGDFIIFLLYIDNNLNVGKNASQVELLRKTLSKSFTMKDLGPIKQIIGIRINRDRNAKTYIDKVLQKFHVDKDKIVSTPFIAHFKLSMKQSLRLKKKRKNIMFFVG